MQRRKTISVPAPYLVGLAKLADEYGLRVILGASDPGDSNGITLAVEYEPEEREEAIEVEDLAGDAWDEFMEDNPDDYED